jgi:hypothetical protein
LKPELQADPAAASRRVQAARQRAARQRAEGLAKAIEQLPLVREQKQGVEAKQQARVSSTDPEARVMKMADGGFRPAFNAQLAVDAATQLIAGVAVVNTGSDMNEMVPMHAQIAQRYGHTPEHWLADGGFTKLQAIEHVSAQGTQPVLPPPKSRNPAIDRLAPKTTDSPHLAQWRACMASAEGQALYRQRGATVECANAQLRRRGLYQFNVRGLAKARAVLLWHALAHNLMRMASLKMAFQA